MRFLGSLVAVVGVAGPLYATGAYLVCGTTVPGERWAGSVLWTVAGILAIVFAKPIGHLLGRGLD